MSPRDQRLVGDRAGADHAVDVLADQVDHPVGHADLDLDIGIAGVEFGQRRDDAEQRDRTADVDAQPALRGRLQQRHAAVELVHVGEDAHGALEIGGAVGRDGHAASRPVEQLCAQMRLQQLDLFAHRRLGRLEQLRGAREGADLDHADKGPHRGKLIHG